MGGGRLRVVRLGARPYERANLRRRLAWTLVTNLRLLRAAQAFELATDHHRALPPMLLGAQA